jgi:hypothetical protein
VHQDATTSVYQEKPWECRRTRAAANAVTDVRLFRVKSLDCNLNRMSERSKPCLLVDCSGRRSGRGFSPLFFEGGSAGAEPRLQEVGSWAMLPLSRARSSSWHLSGALPLHPLPSSRSPGA